MLCKWRLVRIIVIHLSFLVFEYADEIDQASERNASEPCGQNPIRLELSDHRYHNKYCCGYTEQSADD